MVYGKHSLLPFTLGVVNHGLIDILYCLPYGSMAHKCGIHSICNPEQHLYRRLFDPVASGCIMEAMMIDDRGSPMDHFRGRQNFLFPRGMILPRAVTNSVICNRPANIIYRIKLSVVFWASSLLSCISHNCTYSHLRVCMKTLSLFLLAN